jgi:RimJ/RimL family protein N-acetyltransferase
MSVRFTTDRLEVRDLRPEDAQAVFAIWGDAEVLRHSGMDVIEDLVRARAVVARLSGRYSDDGLGWWAVTPRDGGPAIGLCCLQRMPDGVEIEVGYYLRRDRWGEGLGTEIARGCIQHARKALPRASIVAVVDAANSASRRVLEKAGLRHVGPTDYRGARKEKYELDAQQP